MFVHETVNKGGVRVLRCSQSSEEGARCLETPEWIFDRAACCGMVRGNCVPACPKGLSPAKAIAEVELMVKRRI
jgi:succinate dehydrogenase/fumarate reductase-like Fe-S protein